MERLVNFMSSLVYLSFSKLNASTPTPVVKYSVSHGTVFFIQKPAWAENSGKKGEVKADESKYCRARTGYMEELENPQGA